MSTSRAAGAPDRDPAWAVLAGASAPTVAATVVVALITLPFAGVAGAASALAGGLLALAAFATGPVVMRLARGFTPQGVFGAALIAYGVVVIALGIAYVRLDGTDWLVGPAAGAGMFAASAAWMAGQLRRTSRLRILTYGSPAAPGPAVPTRDAE